MHSIRNKKVLFITPYVWTSGTHKGMPTVNETFLGFSKQGYEVHVIVATNQKHKNRVKEGVHYHYVRISPLLSNDRYDEEIALFGAIKSNNKALKHIKFRLVWLWFVIVASVKAVRLTRALDISVIYAMTHFGTLPGYIASKLRRAVFIQRLFGSHALLNWQHKDGSLPWWVFLIRFDELLAMRIPSDLLVLGNDGTAADEQVIRLGVSAEKIRHWLNGIDRTKFDGMHISQREARRQLGIDLDEKRIISTGRLDEWKRVERLLLAIASQRDQFKSIHVDIVGGGVCLSYLQGLATDLGIQGMVHFHGFIPHNRVLLYLIAADVYVSLQDYTNLGNNTIEALTVGKPVVVYDVGTVSRIVRDGIDGVVLQDISPEKIASTLKELLSNDALREKYSISARQRASTLFKSWSERIALEVKEIEETYYSKFNCLISEQTS